MPTLMKYEVVRDFYLYKEGQVLDKSDFPQHHEKDYLGRYLEQGFVKPVDEEKTVEQDKPKKERSSLIGDVDGDGDVDLNDVVQTIKNLGKKKNSSSKKRRRSRSKKK